MEVVVGLGCGMVDKGWEGWVVWLVAAKAGSIGEEDTGISLGLTVWPPILGYILNKWVVLVLGSGIG